MFTTDCRSVDSRSEGFKTETFFFFSFLLLLLLYFLRTHKETRGYLALFDLFSPLSFLVCVHSLVAAMSRIICTIFWLVLVTWGAVLVDVGCTGGEDRLVDLGGSAAGGPEDVPVGGGADVGGEGERVMTIDETGGTGAGEGVGHGPTVRFMEMGESSHPGDTSSYFSAAEEIQTSGGDSEDAFRDLPELSSGERAVRLRQTTLLEAFTSSSGMGQADLQMDEAMEEEDDGSDGEFVADGEQAEADEEDAAGGEPAMQGRRPAKRRRHLTGVGAFGWDTLVGDGPLEGYRRRPSAMLRFRTIAAQQVY